MQLTIFEPQAFDPFAPTPLRERCGSLLVFRSRQQLLSPSDASARVYLRNRGPVDAVFCHVIELGWYAGFELAPGELREGVVARGSNITLWLRPRRVRWYHGWAASSGAAFVEYRIEAVR